MDEYSGKRAVDGHFVPRRGSSLVLRDAADNRDQNPQFCNRIGCSGRLNYSKATQTGFSEKLKSSRSSFQSASGKEIIGSSSRDCSVLTNARKSFQQSKKKFSSQLETDSSESSSIQDEPEVPELIPSPRRNETVFQSEAKNAKGTLTEVGSSSTVPNTRQRKFFRQKSVLFNQDTLPGSSVSLASKSSGQGARNITSTSRYGLRNLRCNSISDVVPQGSSSVESNVGRKRDIVKTRNSEGESSSSGRGKKTSGPAFEDRRISFSTGGISISEARRARNWPPSGENGVASVRTRRSMTGNARMGLSNQVIGNSSSDTLAIIQQGPQPEILTSENYHSSSHQFSAEGTSSHSSTYRRPGYSGENLSSMMPVGSTEAGISRFVSRDGLRRYNIDGIAEVLMALERIEQDEDLTYEQLVALETNLFLGGLTFYDQHREMRLDIDNMSYEELLALEEKMGNVSTALSEEALSKCLRRSIYLPRHLEGTIECSGDGDDIRCSICQEEYVIGDEVGKLGCEHGYHVGCIDKWLRVKNWCPICKASAAPSQSSTPL